jgi:peptidoglycan/LPS O-acetylase OafA/YrhL
MAAPTAYDPPAFTTDPGFRMTLGNADRAASPAATVDPPAAVGQPGSTCWEALGIWRFVLCVIVLAGHETWFSAPRETWAGFLDSFGGKAAVVGFLLVSGYSIAASLERQQAHFYRRRFLRIYPLYFFVLLFTASLEYLLGGHLDLPHRTLDSLGVPTAVGNFFLLQTFVVKPIQFDGPVWSLAVEVFFYLLAPWFAYRSRGVLVALIGVSALCFALPPDASHGLLYTVITKFNALKYLWCWLLGFLLWKQRGPAVYLCLLGGFALMFFADATPEPLSPVTYALSVLLLLFARNLRLPGFLRTIGNYLGDISYPLYLFHLPSMILAYALLGVRSSIGWVACALAISVTAYHLVDRYLKSTFIRPVLLPRAAAVPDLPDA